MTSARIFVHPRCFSGPANGALVAGLETRGFNCEGLAIGPLGLHNRREMLRIIEVKDATTTYERMDGTRFDHRMGQPAPEPEFA